MGAATPNPRANQKSQSLNISARETLYSALGSLDIFELAVPLENKAALNSFKVASRPTFSCHLGCGLDKSTCIASIKLSTRMANATKIKRAPKNLHVPHDALNS
jgi:hypothetical protein